MSMSSTQVTAFKAMGSGIQTSQSTTLFVGFALALCLLFCAWVIHSLYRGWAVGRVSQNDFLWGTARIIGLYCVLTYILL